MFVCCNFLISDEIAGFGWILVTYQPGECTHMMKLGTQRSELGSECSGKQITPKCLLSLTGDSCKTSRSACAEMCISKAVQFLQ